VTERFFFYAVQNTTSSIAGTVCCICSAAQSRSLCLVPELAYRYNKRLSVGLLLT
jgi:hypothetical protein